MFRVFFTRKRKPRKMNHFFAALGILDNKLEITESRYYVSRKNGCKLSLGCSQLDGNNNFNGKCRVIKNTVLIKLVL